MMIYQINMNNFQRNNFILRDRNNFTLANAMASKVVKHKMINPFITEMA